MKRESSVPTDAEREQIRRLQAINRVSQALLAGQDVPSVATHALRELATAVGITVSWVYAVDDSSEGGPRLRLVARRGVSPPRMHQQAMMPMGVGLSGVVAQTGEPIYLRTLDEAPDAARAFLDYARQDGLVALAAIPLAVGDRLLGVLGVGYERPHDWPQLDRELLAVLAGFIALALDRARLQAQLRDLAR